MAINKSFSLAVMAALSTAAGAAEWLGTWGAAPVPPAPTPIAMPGMSFENQTIRQVVRISAGGRRVRVRFTNEYGDRLLLIGAASIALADENGAVQAGTERALQFAGTPSALIPAGAPFLSDPVDLPVNDLASLSISLYLPEATPACTCHPTGLQTAYVSEKGDFTRKAFKPERTIQARAFISGVEVETPRSGKTVVVLGDSISDGMGSTPDANRRWPDLLAERLAKRRGRERWAVVNMGISGNRVLHDGAGVSALARFDRDVLAVPGAAYVIIFEGVNDLGMSWGSFQGPIAERFRTLVPANKATVEMLIAGYLQLIARARAEGLEVFGATIAPYEGAGYYSEKGEEIRRQVNTWIRTSGAFDAVLDFDAVLRDADQPTQIADGLHSGDYLHGSDAGYEALARSIDLALFK